MKRVLEELSNIIAGDQNSVFLTAVCALAGGHLLIEDVPGVGKTLLASSVASACNIDYKRVQCTPDIMPGDILGFSLFDINTGTKRYIEGPVITNLLLVDEINRATPKTQSALLEVMEENRVTVDGEVFDVPSPFMVIATQNPIENVGTAPLPEAQLDRFTMKITMGYPDIEEELTILRRFAVADNAPVATPVLSKGELQKLQRGAENIHVENSVMRYIVDIITATRAHQKISLGCSPRASLVLLRCAKARAMLLGRDFVIPDDVKALAACVLSHRITLTFQLKGIQNTQFTRSLIDEIVAEIPIKNQKHHG